jgi:hypothetical protein
MLGRAFAPQHDYSRWRAIRRALFLHGAQGGYRRGRISVFDARGLGKKACECYRFIRQQYRRLQGELLGLFSLK